MSLINKMLSDLEQRHSADREQDRVLLDGLNPVANTGFAERRIPYNFLLLCFFIATVLMAVYGYWKSRSGGPAIAPSQQVVAVVEEIAPAVVVTERLIPATAALKLDFSLPVIATPSVHEEVPPAPVLPESEPAPAPESIELVELIPVIDETPVSAESGYGQMEIKPAAPVETRPLQRWMGEARSAYQAGDYKRGDESLLAILQQDPLYMDARMLYATSLAGRGDTDAAMQQLRSGLELNAAVPEWAMLYARMLMDQGRDTEAAGVLAKSLPALDNHADYYALYAALLQRLSRHDEAAVHYQALLARQPDNGVWWIGLAISLERLQKPGEALAAYRRALGGQPIGDELKQFAGEQIGRLER